MPSTGRANAAWSSDGLCWNYFFFFTIPIPISKADENSGDKKDDIHVGIYVEICRPGGKIRMADGKLSGIIQKITANIIGEGNPYTAKKCTQTAFDKTIDREIANYEEKEPYTDHQDCCHNASGFQTA